MNNFEEASLEEVNQLGEMASTSSSLEPSPDPSLLPPDAQPDLVIHPDNVKSNVGITASNSEYSGFPTLVTATDNKVSQEDVPVAPVLEQDVILIADNDIINKPLDIIKTDSKPTTTHISEMDSVSLSDNEDGTVVTTHVIVNETQAKEEVEKDNSTYLLERIRELKDERDQVKNHYCL
jgi:hypothetical protein